MRIPAHLIPYGLKIDNNFNGDGDSAYFISKYDEPIGKIMEVGAHDEPMANILSQMGNDVYGVDLREYDPESPPCNYHYVRGDFCDLPLDFLKEHLGTFDCIFSLSAIEHFGLTTYDEGDYSPYYDIIALRMMYLYLKEGGTAYITVPFGNPFKELAPHWRVYDVPSLMGRLAQDFHIEDMSVYVTAECVVAGKQRHAFGEITEQEILGFDGDPPHLSAFLRLRKTGKKRLAKDGR